MKKKLLALLTAMAVIFSGNCFAYANGESGDAQILMVPITEQREKQGEGKMNLMSLDDGIIINNIRFRNIIDGYFDIEINMNDFGDARKKLTISVVDANGVVYASQESVFYKTNELVYRMKLVKTMSMDDEYFLKLSYSGKYSLVNYADTTYRYRGEWERIENIDIIDVHNNVFDIYITNPKPNTTYTLFYVGENGDYVSRNVKPGNENIVRVEFGQEIEFSEQNSICLCKEGSEDPWELWISEEGLYSYQKYDVVNSGVSCEEYIPKTAASVYFEFYEKGYAYLPYTNNDVENIDVYLFDATEGKTVSGGIDSVTCDSGMIWGSLEISDTLYADHEYIMVFNDGYSLRICEPVVTDEAKISGIYLYDADMKQLQYLQKGTTQFYCRVSAENMDSKNAVIELIDGSSNVIATSTYNKTKGAHLIKVSKGLAEGEYTLSATCEGLTFKRKVTVGEVKTSSVYQLARCVDVFNGTAYIEMLVDSSLDPSSLTYEMNFNGADIKADFYRDLYEDKNNKYFIIKAQFPYQNSYGRAYVKAYKNGQYVAPEHMNNMDAYINYRKGNTFLYNTKNITDEYVEFFTEGVTTNGTYTLCGYDDETKKTVELSATGKNSVTFSRAELEKIVAYCKLETEYGGEEKRLYLEFDDELVEIIYDYEGLVKYELIESFSFQQNYTSKKYVVINLPYKTYSKYKIASTEAGLSSATYKNIDTGILYEISETPGIQTVYAKFRTAAGKESEIQKISIVYDQTPPEFEVYSNLSRQYTVTDRGYYFEFPVLLNASEAGQLYVEFEDEDSNRCAEAYSTDVIEGENIASLYVYDDYGELMFAKKMKMYMVDKAGKKSEEHIFDISVVNAYEGLACTSSYVYDEYAYVGYEDYMVGSVIYAAVYDEENRLVQIVKQEITEDMEDGCEFSFDESVERGSKVKVFVWDNGGIDMMSYAETLIAQ